MLRYTLRLMVVAAAVSCGNAESPEASAPDKPQTQSENKSSSDSASRVEHEKMVQILRLNETESAALMSAFDEGDAAIQKWQSLHGAELRNLEAQMKDAAASRNLAGVREATSKAGPLRQELVQLAKTSQEKILNSLPPEKRVEWDAHLLAEKLFDLMQPLALTPEQRAAIANRAVSAARTVARSGRPGDTMAGAFLKLERDIEQSILTPQQRPAYDLIKKKNPLRSLSL